MFTTALTAIDRQASCIVGFSPRGRFPHSESGLVIFYPCSVVQ
jgi:hypothetical protein